ncbi:hypothetical protein E2C01_008516 [Portunus trituberculatus]|uniref:Uncharacterized protein n=1 Tax=Portunus trituberculatus TaxID=210409 RepID=A0A5B7D2L1_PORTR|nr:hypothetical protein [Portunus trituberculatus]
MARLPAATEPPPPASACPAGTAMVQWNHVCFGVRGVSKRTSSNPLHGLSVGWLGFLTRGNGFLLSLEPTCACSLVLRLSEPRLKCCMREAWLICGAAVG